LYKEPKIFRFRKCDNYIYAFNRCEEEIMGKFDFAVARVMHVAWKSSLRSFLDGKESMSPEQAVSHRDCDLGKWLYSDGMSEYGSFPEMQELEKVHIDLHAIVKRVIQLKQSGDKATAEQELAKLESVSQKIFSLLVAIEQKTK
jgi:methyl-accepting chemotaxis protein